MEMYALNIFLFFCKNAHHHALVCWFEIIALLKNKQDELRTPKTRFIRYQILTAFLQN